MTDSIFKLGMLLLMLGLAACASAPEKTGPSTHWRDEAESFLQAGMEYYRNYLYPQAIIEFDNARRYYQGYDDQQNLLYTHINLAQSWLALDETERASEQLSLARRVNERLLDNSRGIRLDIIESSISLEKNDPQQARAILSKYPVSPIELKDERYAAILINQIRASFASGEDSSSFLNLMRDLATQSPLYQARYLRFQAQMSKDAHNVDRLMEQALAIYRDQASPRAVLSTYHEWAGYLENQQRYPQAQEKLQILADISRSQNNRVREQDALERLANIQ